MHTAARPVAASTVLPGSWIFAICAPMENRLMIPSIPYAFDRKCTVLRIDHLLTKPRCLQTNVMAEATSVQRSGVSRLGSQQRYDRQACQRRPSKGIPHMVVEREHVSHWNSDVHLLDTAG